jgi:hypothetical protein
MTDTPIVDVDTLRDQVRETYRAVAVDPDATYQFHTGRPSTPSSPPTTSAPTATSSAST